MSQNDWAYKTLGVIGLALGYALDWFERFVERTREWRR